MKFTFLFGGGKFDQESAALAESFRERVARHADVDIILLGDRTKDPDADMLRKIPDGAAVLLFDERGKMRSSDELATLVDRTKQEGTSHLMVIIGGAYGVGDSVRERADHVIAFSPMVFPHQLARIMALEQIYRALSILAGSKYHHA